MSTLCVCLVYYASLLLRVAVGLEQLQRKNTTPAPCYCGPSSDHWFVASGACFAHNERPLRRVDAHIHCLGLGGHLAHFDTGMQQRLAMERIGPWWNPVWIGPGAACAQCNWTAPDGGELPFTAWIEDDFRDSNHFCSYLIQMDGTFGWVSAACDCCMVTSLCRRTCLQPPTSAALAHSKHMPVVAVLLTTTVGTVVATALSNVIGGGGGGIDAAVPKVARPSAESVPQQTTTSDDKQHGGQSAHSEEQPLQIATADNDTQPIGDGRRRNDKVQRDQPEPMCDPKEKSQKEDNRISRNHLRAVFRINASSSMLPYTHLISFCVFICLFT